MPLGGGEAERMSTSSSTCDCICAVKVVMDGCRGADLYALMREPRRGEGPRTDCGVEHRDVKGEISSEHASMLNRREVEFAEDSKEKFSLNMLAGMCDSRWWWVEVSDYYGTQW